MKWKCLDWIHMLGKVFTCLLRSFWVYSLQVTVCRKYMRTSWLHSLNSCVCVCVCVCFDLIPLCPVWGTARFKYHEMPGCIDGKILGLDFKKVRQGNRSLVTRGHLFRNV